MVRETMADTVFCPLSQQALCLSSGPDRNLLNLLGPLITPALSGLTAWGMVQG